MASWRRFEAEGALWEARVVASEEVSRSGADQPDEILEFRCLDGTRPPRRLAISADAMASLDHEGLLAAYRRARPIGGDFYGRPGKRMSDAGEDQ